MRINIVGLTINLMVEEDNNIRNMLSCLYPSISPGDDDRETDISMELRSDSKTMNILKIPDTAKEVFCDHFIRHCEDEKGNIYTTNGSSLLVGDPVNSRILGFISQNENLSVGRELILSFLTFFLRSKGLFSLHASCLTETNEGGLLFPGKDGCGKSTIARGLARLGFKCLSHNTSYLCGLDSKVWVISSFKINEESLFATESDNSKDKKNLLYNLYNLKPHIDRSLPRFIIFPHITGSKKSKIIPISTDEALIYLLESIPYLGESNQGRVFKHIELLKRLTKQSSAYRLLSGMDIKESPSRLYTILKESKIII